MRITLSQLNFSGVATSLATEKLHLNFDKYYMKKWLTIILMSVVITMVTACGVLPFPVQLFSTGKTVYDGAMMLDDKKTSTDEIVSAIKNKECKTTNIIKGQSYCQKQKTTVEKTTAELLKEYINDLKDAEEEKEPTHNLGDL